jgi:hypothetical protein
MKAHQGLIAAGCLGIVAAFGTDAGGSSPAVLEVTTECHAQSNNDGCETWVACPPGTTIRTARAACNLEYGPVTDEQLSSVEQGHVEVVRRSDHVDEGSCWLGTAQVGSGRVTVANIVGLTGVTVGCQEHDKNGGDCQIRGSLHCE